MDERHNNCILCRRGMHNRRYQRHILTANIVPQNCLLLRGRIQSRHVRARSYLCYILINNNINNAIGIRKIAQYYCTCLTGRRTIGSCAHVVSIVWYLGAGRHELFIPPAGHLTELIIDEHFA